MNEGAHRDLIVAREGKSVLERHGRRERSRVVGRQRIEPVVQPGAADRVVPVDLKAGDRLPAGRIDGERGAKELSIAVGVEREGQLAAGKWSVEAKAEAIVLEIRPVL